MNLSIGIEIADAHSGNFVKSEEGILVPIDILAFKYDVANYSIPNSKPTDGPNLG